MTGFFSKVNEKLENYLFIIISMNYKLYFSNHKKTILFKNVIFQNNYYFQKISLFLKYNYKLKYTETN